MKLTGVYPGIETSKLWVPTGELKKFAILAELVLRVMIYIWLPIVDDRELNILVVVQFTLRAGNWAVIPKVTAG